MTIGVCYSTLTEQDVNHKCVGGWHLSIIRKSPTLKECTLNQIWQPCLLNSNLLLFPTCGLLFKRCLSSGTSKNYFFLQCFGDFGENFLVFGQKLLWNIISQKTLPNIKYPLLSLPWYKAPKLSLRSMSKKGKILKKRSIFGGFLISGFSVNQKKRIHSEIKEQRATIYQRCSWIYF